MSQGFDMGAVQLAMVTASQRAQDKVSKMLDETTQIAHVSSQLSTATVGGSAVVSTNIVTQFKFDLTNPTNSALFNAAVNNLQLINNYTTATLQSLKTMISTNISNMR